VTEIAFVDTETTGLEPDRHDVWEIAVITADHDRNVGVVNEQEYVWLIIPDLSKADPTALRISRFYERTSLVAREWKNNGWSGNWSNPNVVAPHLAKLLAGRHLIGAVPSFDEKFLDRFLRRFGVCLAAHYHLIDVENLAAAKLRMPPPWDSEELSRALSVDPDRFERHTALGDARWAKALYEAVYAP
jgi:DNA polymerase III epsilon subunit-like protein